jgi:acyl-CoA thioesterase
MIGMVQTDAAPPAPEEAAEAARLFESLSPRDRVNALEVLRRFAVAREGGPYSRLLGLTLESSGEGRARMRLAVVPAFFNPARILHGGAIFTLVDTAMAMALTTAIDEDDRFSGVELKINFLSATKDGELVCDAWVRRVGGRIAVLEAEVTRPDGELVALATGTSYVIRKT